MALTYFLHNVKHFTMFKSLPKFQNLHGKCKVNSQACLSAHELKGHSCSLSAYMNETMSVEKRKQTDIV